MLIMSSEDVQCQDLKYNTHGKCTTLFNSERMQSKIRTLQIEYEL